MKSLKTILLEDYEMDSSMSDLLKLIKQSYKTKDYARMSNVGELWQEVNDSAEYEWEMFISDDPDQEVIDDLDFNLTKAEKCQENINDLIEKISTLIKKDPTDKHLYGLSVKLFKEVDEFRIQWSIVEDRINSLGY